MKNSSYYCPGQGANPQLPAHPGFMTHTLLVQPSGGENISVAFENISFMHNFYYSYVARFFLMSSQLPPLMVGPLKEGLIFRSTGPIAVARRRSVGRSVGRSVRRSVRQHL